MGGRGLSIALLTAVDGGEVPRARLSSFQLTKLDLQEPGWYVSFSQALQHAQQLNKTLAVALDRGVRKRLAWHDAVAAEHCRMDTMGLTT